MIGKKGRSIPASRVQDYIKGYVLGLDMTARNLQEEAKKKGLPWSMSKGFDTFTPLGTFIPKSQVKDAHDLQLTLKVDGQIKQDGSTRDMIFQSSN